MEHARSQVPPAAVEQYKRELMAQARRGAPAYTATYTEQPAQTPAQRLQPAQAHESFARRAEEAAEHAIAHAEHAAAKAIEYAEPAAQSVVPALANSGLAAAARNRSVNIALDPSLNVSPGLNVSPNVNIAPNISPSVNAAAIAANRSAISAQQPPSQYRPIMPAQPPPPPRPSVIVPTVPPVPTPTLPVPPQPPIAGCVPEQPVIPCPCHRPIEPCDNTPLRPQPRTCPVHGSIKKQCAICQAKQAPAAMQIPAAAQAPVMPEAAGTGEAPAAAIESRLPGVANIFRPPPPPPRPPVPPPPPRPPAAPVPPVGQIPACPIAPICVCPAPPFNPVPFPGPCRPCPSCPPCPPPRPPFFRTQAAERQASMQDAWYMQGAQGTDDYAEPDAQTRYAYRVPEDTVAMASSTNATDYAETLSKVAYMDPTVPPPIEGRTEANGTWELPDPQFASLDDFLAKNTGRGVLTMQALADESGAPIQGARVRVTKNIGGVDYQFYDVQTDARGEAGRLLLPAPEKQLSSQPPHGTAPYALYDVTVSLNNQPDTLENVVIFADTESMQALDTGEGETFDESQYTM